MNKTSPFILVLSLMMFSSPSLSDWTQVGKNSLGSTFYVDFERIKEHGKYVYFWNLVDWVEPNVRGNLSNKNYYKGDCDLFRTDWLSMSYHKGSMGEGPEEHVGLPPRESRGWVYPLPDSSLENLLEVVCNHVN